MLQEKVSRCGACGHSVTASMGGSPITADSNLAATSNEAVGGAGDVEASTAGELVPISRAAKTPSSFSV